MLTTVIHHNTLSQRDQELKSRLFSKKPRTSPRKPQPISLQKPIEIPAKNPVSDAKIDDFLKEMQEDLRKTGESTKKPRKLLNFFSRARHLRDSPRADAITASTERNYQQKPARVRENVVISLRKLAKSAEAAAETAERAVAGNSAA